MISDPAVFVVHWLHSFDSDSARSCSSMDDLSDGRVLLSVASEMYVNHLVCQSFNNSFQAPFSGDTPDDIDSVLSLIRLVQHHFLLSLKRDISAYPLRLDSIIKGNEEAILDLVKLLFLAQVECERCEDFLPRILELPEETKSFLAEVVESLREDPRVQYVAGLVGNESEIIERDRREEIESELDKVKLESRTSLATRDRLLEELKEEKEALVESLRRAHEDCGVANLKDQILELTPSLTEARHQLSQEKKIEVGGDVDALRAEHHTLEARLEDMQGEIERLVEASEVSKRKHADESTALTRVIEDYRDNVATLTNKVKDLQALVAKSDSEHSNDATAELRMQLEAAERDRHGLASKLSEAKREAQAAMDDAEAKEKELNQFIMTGGSLGGELRDRIVKTMQEQLVVREEELEFYRSQHLEALEEQRKVERLLVTAVHSLALNYHEEMVARLHEPPQELDTATKSTPISPDDFYAQEYNNSS